MARMIDADALIAPLKLQMESYDRIGAHEKAETIRNCLWEISEAPTVNGWISVKEAANIIAELFGDDCACNFNGIDEWLPQYCEYAGTDCPHPAGTTCWEQYIKYLSKRPKEAK